MNSVMQIANRKIGAGHPTYVVAELSANHNQSFERAAALVQAAKDAGADAVKLQTYTPATLTIDCDLPPFLVEWGDPPLRRTLHDLYREAHMPWDWQPRLQQLAHQLGLDFFSTVYDESALAFLTSMSVPAFKIASFELTDHALLRAVAATARPILLSTGMATWKEVDAALQVLRSAGGEQVALLKCTSAYPAPPDELNLRALQAMQRRYSVPVGLSDHSLHSTAVVGAVALGACIVEKHLTLSRSDPGPDSAFSLEPDEFKEMVHAVRVLERALGDGELRPGAREASSLVFRRSIFVVKDVEAGAELSSENVRVIRPGQGLAPCHLREVLGRRAARSLIRGTPLSWDDLE